MPLLRRAVLSVAALFSIVLASPPARAGERGDAPPTFSVRFNPLALAIGRVSGEAELWFTRHLSIVGTGFAASFAEEGGIYSISPGDATTTARSPSSRLSLAGFEAGLRYTYLERTRSSVRLGAFGGAAVGPSWGRWSTTGDASNRITELTVAVETGALVIAGPLIAELGFGLQGTHVDGRDPSVGCGDAYLCVSTTHWFYGAGFTPRVLASFGVAF